MSYIVANNKSYLVTNNYNKPYIKISNSILPLTTNAPSYGGGVIKCNINGNTYRVLEYRSTSSSSSDSYYTSAVNSDGLSNTTALTRSSTSGESYLTRSSTSGTSYGTTYTNQRYYSWSQEATSQYYTYTNYYTKVTAISYLPEFTTIQSIWNQGSYYLYFNIQYLNNQKSIYAGRMVTSRICRNGATYTDYIDTYSWKYTTYYNTQIMFISSNTIGPQSLITTSYTEYTYGETRSTNKMSTTFYNLVNVVVTTGTTYLTRSSTSATQYLTRSSTSGYSGKSSSSKSIEISSWL